MDTGERATRSEGSAYLHASWWSDLYIVLLPQARVSTWYLDTETGISIFF